RPCQRPAPIAVSTCRPASGPSVVSRAASNATCNTRRPPSGHSRNGEAGMQYRTDVEAPGARGDGPELPRLKRRAALAFLLGTASTALLSACGTAVHPSPTSTVPAAAPAPTRPPVPAPTSPPPAAPTSPPAPAPTQVSAAPTAAPPQPTPRPQ